MTCYRWACLAAMALVLNLAACSDDDDNNNNQNQNPVCGNGIIEPGEQCEGTDLAGETCTSQGLEGGELACTAECTFDLSACEGCGNGVMEIGEECDASDFGTQTCANSGFQSGELTCTSDCTVDLSSCVGGCGNGVVESGEECDPPDGSTCASDCTLIGGDECDEPDSYDTDCETATTGQWCWDGGDGGSLFCGCDPEYGDTDCQLEGYERCNPDTLRCEPPPDCGNDSNEGNDDEANATILSAATDVTGATCGYDPDWFTFTAGTGAVEVLVTWTDDGETDLDAYVTDCATTVLGRGESAVADSEQLVVTDLAAGTDYCLLVQHYSGAAGGADVSYTLRYEERVPCTLDSDCSSGEYCPLMGAGAGVCQGTAPAGAGCGDAVAGDNETSGLAETLTSGATLTEDSCDGHPNGPVDVDWFTFDVAAGEALSLTVEETTFDDTQGDVDVLLYDDTGELWAARATTENPETLSGTGLPAGTYYVAVQYWDNDSSAAGSTTYEITATLTAASGCADRGDCTYFIGHGECTSNLCEDFQGNAAQGPGDFCDDTDDCDPALTGSQFINGLCLNPNSARYEDNVCTLDCTGESDCTPYNMHCFIWDTTNSEGFCIAPCLTDVDCYGHSCDSTSGICTRNP